MSAAEVRKVPISHFLVAGILALLSGGMIVTAFDLLRQGDLRQLFPLLYGSVGLWVSFRLAHPSHSRRESEPLLLRKRWLSMLIGFGCFSVALLIHFLWQPSPRTWGEFTVAEHTCSGKYSICRDVGVWVSDDLQTELTPIILYGPYAQGKTVRSYAQLDTPWRNHTVVKAGQQSPGNTTICECGCVGLVVMFMGWVQSVPKKKAVQPSPTRWDEVDFSGHPSEDPDM